MDLKEDSRDEIVDTLLMRKDSYRAKDEDMRWSGKIASNLRPTLIPTVPYSIGLQLVSTTSTLLYLYLSSS